jgi:hypothetical protein
MVVLLGKKNTYKISHMQKGGSIKVHQQVTDDNQTYLPGGMAAIQSLNKFEKVNPVATSTVAKSIPDLQVGGHLMNSLNNIRFRNTKKSKNIKLKI